ncbi:diflavin flavo A [Micractinium conductrix]|uniref:Diflavin flavo A n=1 Tax=Micractinium conductrix TaxID=554055 RepID=A0A2P6VS62_9CHLO|nr:diflavin flavo A [Micractinium conductrix]|eukprot:PSC76929.1 diflavin flavo A [Micractinium conductrix]
MSATLCAARVQASTAGSSQASRAVPRSGAAARPAARPAPRQQQHRGQQQQHVANAAAVEAPASPHRMSEIEMWNGNKRLQTLVTDVAANTITIRSLDWDRDRFDIEFALQEGTTYNSYLIFGADKTALVDASHEKFRGLFMRTLNEELAKQGRSIDYVFCSHTEPDHSGLVKDVVEQFPEAIVCGSKVCLAFLDNLIHVPFKKQAVKGGDKIDLGGGHVLEFVMAPNLHWPDTMFTFDHATNVMYTCDAFGLHYCTEDPFDSELKPLEPHYQFYYQCLMGPNARSVSTALRKVKDLPYEIIANGHGPLLRYNVPELVGRYDKWSKAIAAAPASVMVLYAADYGFSDRLSQTLAHGITKAGVATEMADVLSMDPQELVEMLSRNSGVVLMTPPNDAPEARGAINTLLSAIKPKQKVVVAESYGGRDEPLDSLVSGLVSAGVEPLLDLRVKEEPTEGVYQLFEEAGTDLAQALIAKDTIAKKKAAMNPDVAKALARVSGGLYIVTAAHNNAKSAMVASWVAQASFEPLGLTIAVAKDRAIESLMQVGDSFVLNCLGDGEYNALLKHFLQRFPPGADRFEGINWQPAASGSPVLNDAIAHMECKVVSRMETADHWVTYAEVVEGQVAQPDKRTAVHRRKVASYY